MTLNFSPDRNHGLRASTELRRLEKGEIAARRRAFLQDWIASRQRRVQVLGAGALLFLPILAAMSETAEAQAGGPVPVGAINGVTSASLNADGSMQLSLANGQVISIPAAEVTVLADGTLALSAVAAEYVATLAAVGAAAAGVGAAAIAAGGGALAVVAGLAGGGDEEPVPVVTAALSTGLPTLNATEVLSAITFQGTAPAGSLVTVTIGGVQRTATADTDGNYTVTFNPGDFPAGDGAFDVTLKAEEVDSNGLPVGDPLATSTTTITVDTTPPTVAITSPIAGDNVVNTAEAGTNQTISGTTDAEDGQVVTVTLNGKTYDGLVVGGAWTVTVPAADLAALPEGAPLTVAADVRDAAGNSAAQATVNITADLTAPTIAIDGTLAGNNVFTKANEASGLVVSGTTDAEAGQVVTVSYNGTDYTSAPLTGAAWSVTIPAAAFAGVATGDTLGPITARVSDVAGNPSAVASGPTINVDLTGPTIAIDPISGDDVINAAESGSDVTISGTATGADGQTATIAISGTAFSQTVTVTGGTWSVTLPAADAAALGDAGAFTVTADVSDSENIAAPQATRGLATDFTAPTVTISGTVSGTSTSTALSTDNIVNAIEQGQSLDISGTTTGVEDGQLVTVQFAGAVTFSTTAEVINGAWTVGVTPNIVQDLIAGGASINFTATVNDAAGNPQVAPATLTVTSDTTAPTISFDPLPFGISLDAAEVAAGQTISGTTTGAPGRPIEIRLFSGGTERAIETTTTDATTGAWSVTFDAATLGALPQGAVAINARVTDVAGNLRNQTFPTDPIVDTVAPTISIGSVGGDGVISVAEQVAFGAAVTGTSAGAENGSVVTVTVNGGAGGTGVVDADGNWTVTVPAANLAGLATGDTPSFVASVTDTAGNTGTSAPFNAAVDVTPPTIAVTSVAGDGLISAAEKAAGFAVSGTSDVEAGRDVSVVLTSGGVTITATGQTVAGGGWTVSFTTSDLAPLPEGPVNVTGNVGDAAGNGAASATFVATADLTPPTVTLDALPFGAGMSAAEAGVDQTISGTAPGAEGQQVTVTVSDGTTTVTLTPTAAVAVGGAWTTTLTSAQIATLAQGNITVSATASDAAGNPAAAPATTTFALDSVPPALAITGAQSGGVDVGASLNIAERDAGVTVSGTSDAEGQTVTVTATGPGGFSATATGTVTGGAWSATFNGLSTIAADGTLAFSASVSDVAGNPTTTAPLNVPVDVTPPTIAINPIGDGGVYDRGQGALSITGTTDAEAGQTVTVTLEGQTYTGNVVAGGGGANTWSATIPSDAINALATGSTFTASATVTDAAGNAAAAPATGDIVPYAAAVTYLTEIGRSGSEVRLGYFVDPRQNLGFDDFVLAEQSFFDTATATYLPVFPVPTLGGQPQYTSAPAPALQDPPTAADIAAGQPRFLAFWLGDAANSTPALFDTSIPVVQYSLGLADPTAPYTVTSQFSPGGGLSPVRQTLSVGSDAGDTLAAPATDSVIRGRGGDDAIDMSAGGVNTVIFEATQALNGTDTITGFSVAPGTALPDRIGFAGLSNADLRGTGAEFQALAADGTLGANTGFAVITAAVGDLSAAGMATAAAGLGGEAGSDVIYLLASDGTDAALARVSFSAPDTATADVLANFTGLADVSGITANEILGFNPAV